MDIISMNKAARARKEFDIHNQSNVLVENGIIVNIILANPDFAESLGAKPHYPGAAVGLKYVQPTTQADTDALITDLIYSVTLLELGIN